MSIHPDFKHLFQNRESLELLGKKYRNLWILIGILTITFLSIGFASGSLRYLNKKMNNPFIKWITVPIPATDAAQTERFKTALNEPNLKKQFNYDTISSFSNYFFTIQYKNGQRKDLVKGRTIEINDRLLGEILSPKNDMIGRSFEGAQDVGIIATRDFLHEFGYLETDPVVLMDITDTRQGENGEAIVKNNRAVPIPIRAVINSLPGSNRIAFTPYFLSQRRRPDGSGNSFNPFNHDADINRRQLIYFINSDDDAVQNDFQEKINAFCQQNNFAKQYQPHVFITDNDYTNKGKNIHINFDEEPDSIGIIDSIDRQLSASPDIKAYNHTDDEAFKYIRFYEYDLRNFTGEIRSDYLSIMLHELNHVRELRNYILTNHDLEIDISKVESLENYHFVSRLTYILSTVLIIFSVLTICLFVSNLLRTHLDSIKMNLGTFKAFGLDNQTLSGIYLRMIFGIIAKAILVALVISALLGYLGIGRVILWALNGKLETKERYFQLFALPTVLAIVIIGVTIYQVILLTTRKTLQKTPGDLIYDRD